MKPTHLAVITPFILLSLGQTSFAQREAPTRQDKREARQQGNEDLTPEQRTQNFQQRWQERLNAMTPEQRERMGQMRAQFENRMKEAGIAPPGPNDPTGAGSSIAPPAPVLSKDELRRQLMNAAGITNRNVQTAILAFAISQEKARQPLLKLAQDAAIAMSPPPTVPAPAVLEVNGQVQTAPVVDAAMVVQGNGDDKVVAAFEAYQTALGKERVRYAASLKTLDREIKYSTNPRVQGFLTLAGILEFEPLTFGGAGAIFAPVLEANAAAQAKAEQEAVEKARAEAARVAAIAAETAALSRIMDGNLPVGFGGSRRAQMANTPVPAPADPPAAPPAGFGARPPAAQENPVPLTPAETAPAEAAPAEPAPAAPVRPAGETAPGDPVP